MHHLFDVTTLISTYGYIGIFVIVFFESGLIFALPGDSLLFTAGIMAAGGLLSIAHTIPIVFVGTMLGGMFGYWIGKNIERLRTHSSLRYLLKEEHIQKTHDFMDKYGTFSIIVSRFVPIVRTFAPIVAGVAAMPYRKFFRYSLISAVLWSASVPLIGYFLGRQFPWIVDYMSAVIIGAVVLSLVPVVVGVLRRKKR